MTPDEIDAEIEILKSLPTLTSVRAAAEDAVRHYNTTGDSLAALQMVASAMNRPLLTGDRVKNEQERPLTGDTADKP